MPNETTALTPTDFQQLKPFHSRYYISGPASLTTDFYPIYWILIGVALGSRTKSVLGNEMAGEAKTSRADEATTRLCRRVRTLRRQRRWTLEQLAAESRVSRSMLSQIERNEANPTFNVAYRIAQAFGLSLGELADLSDESEAIRVIHADDESFMFRDDAECSLRTLFPLHLAKNVEFYELKLRPDGVLHSSPHMRGTTEFLTVQKGTLCVQSGDATAQLKARDSAHYRADVIHSIENTGRGEAVAFLVSVYRGADMPRNQSISNNED